MSGKIGSLLTLSNWLLKKKIRDLLRKLWNPYVVGRHAFLTQKSRILKEATLWVFAGWTTNSDMPRRYIHLFGNAACEDILEAYGFVSKDQQTLLVWTSNGMGMNEITSLQQISQELPYG
jgi:hypothetical protein